MRPLLDSKQMVALTMPYRERNRALELRLFLEVCSLLAIFWTSVLLIHSTAFALTAGALMGVLVYMRLFSMFHEHAHGVFLDHASIAGVTMRILARFLMLSDLQIWKKGHNHHHNQVGHFGVLLPGAIGLVTREKYNKLSPRKRAQYDLFRNNAFLFVFSYFTIFIGYFNLLPAYLNRSLRWNGIGTIASHALLATAVSVSAGVVYGFALVILPAMVAACLGSLVLYLQHIFPSADYSVSTKQPAHERAMACSSKFRASRLVLWCLGDEEHHHIHHLNPGVPFYRHKEAYEREPGLRTPHEFDLNVSNILKALDCFVWDPERGCLISKREALAAPRDGAKESTPLEIRNRA